MARGTNRSKEFVNEGGSYLGICAGGYYGSAYVEFDKGDPNMEVVGPRELAFFPVTAEGPVFPGFSYKLDKGAYAAEATITSYGKEILGLPEETFPLYYNGGCEFSQRTTDDFDDLPYKVFVSYSGQSKPHPPSPPLLHSTAAIVGGSVGRGRVILSGLHFEASVSLLRSIIPMTSMLLTCCPC